MDPASIAGLATSSLAVAVRAARKLADLKAAIPRIRETVEGLLNQVTGMESVLVVLIDVVERPGFETHVCHTDMRLKEWVPVTIKNCEAVLRRVKCEVDSIQTNKKPGLVADTLMAARYQWVKNDLQDLLDQVKMHSMNLQLATDTVNLYRQQPIHQMTEQIDRMEQKINALHARMDQNPSSAALEHDQYLMDIRINDCTVPLMRIAERALSSVLSATGRHSSVAQSVSSHQPAFQYIDEAIRSRERTVEWLHSATPPGETVELPGTKPSSYLHTPPASVLGINEIDHRTPHISQHGVRQQFYIPSDADRSISLENVSNMFQEGEELAKQGRWLEADQELTGAFKATPRFTTERRERLRLLERQILWGRCKMELGEFKAADKILREVTKEGSSQYGPLVLQAVYMFAELNLKHGNYRAAGEYCRQALHGQEKIFTEKHEACYASSALLSKIMLAEGDPIQAKYYARRLPGRLRPQLVQELNEFATQDSHLELFPDMGPCLSKYARPYFKLDESDASSIPTAKDTPVRHIYLSTAGDVRDRANSASSRATDDNGFHLPDDSDNKSNKSESLGSEADHTVREIFPAEVSMAEIYQQRSLSMTSMAMSESDQTNDTSSNRPPPLIAPSSRRYDEFIQNKFSDSEQWYHAVEIQAQKFNGESWERIPPFMKIEHSNGSLNLEVGRMNFAHFKGANHPCRRLNEPFFHQVAFWQDGAETMCECTIEYDRALHSWSFQSVAGYAWLNGEFAEGRVSLRENFRVYLSSSRNDATPSVQRSSWAAMEKDVEFRVLLLDVQLIGDPKVGYWPKARRDFH